MSRHSQPSSRADGTTSTGGGLPHRGWCPACRCNLGKYGVATDAQRIEEQAKVIIEQGQCIARLVHGGHR
jgi:hypothetical protein